MSTRIRPSIGPSGIDQVLRTDTGSVAARKAAAFDRWLAARLQRASAHRRSRVTSYSIAGSCAELPMPTDEAHPLKLDGSRPAKAGR